MIPKMIPKEEARVLNQPITIDEVDASISSLPNGKSLGIDGIPIEFYK